MQAIARFVFLRKSTWIVKWIVKWKNGALTPYKAFVPMSVLAMAWFRRRTQRYLRYKAATIPMITLLRS